MDFHDIISYLRELNTVSVILRLALATFFGGIIGLERGKKRRPAGFRTHMLVCIGAALAMMTNTYICHVFPGAHDPARLGAQVISGIGFLGAGTIIVTGRQQVKGLTTAAGLWASACMGLAIGVGFYEGAILGGVSILLIITVLHRLDYVLCARSKVIDLFIELRTIDCAPEVMSFLRVKGMKISSFEMSETQMINRENVGVIMTVSSPKQFDHSDLLSDIGMLDGVRFIEEI